MVWVIRSETVRLEAYRGDEESQQFLLKNGYTEADKGAGGDEESYEQRAVRVARLGFIRKVYGLLLVQLGVLIVNAVAVAYNDEYRDFVVARRDVLIVCVCIFSLFVLLRICVPSLYTRYPLNLWVLATITLTSSYLIGACTASFTASSVLVALGLTAVLVAGLTLFSFFVKMDLTILLGVVLVVFLSMLSFAVVLLLAPSPFMELLYAWACAVGFSLYLILHTKLIIGDKRHSFGFDQQVEAAVLLWLDIINLLLSVLRITGSRR